MIIMMNRSRIVHTIETSSRKAIQSKLHYYLVFFVNFFEDHQCETLIYIIAHGLIFLT